MIEQMSLHKYLEARINFVLNCVKTVKQMVNLFIWLKLDKDNNQIDVPCY